MKKTRIIASITTLICIALDQLVKLWALDALPGNQIEVIPGLFYLTYVENRGAAFGIFQGNTLILAIIPGVAMLLAIVYVFRSKTLEPYFVHIIMLVVAGGLGNWLDRMFRGYVVDYLDFSAIFSFPVFNLADCFVVCGTLLLLICVLRAERDRERNSDTADEA
jgi:signal peptidase II